MSGVAEVLQETLRQLADRRRKLEPFVDELSELDIVERDLRKTAAKLAKRSGGRHVRPVASLGEADTPAPPNGNGGTHRDRALAVLASHPAGLSASKVGELASIPSAQVYQVLSAMAADDNALVVKVGRGFYRLASDIAGSQVDASLSDEEREELADRAVA